MSYRPTNLQLNECAHVTKGTPPITKSVIIISISTNVTDKSKEIEWSTERNEICFFIEYIVCLIGFETIRNRILRPVAV